MMEEDATPMPMDRAQTPEPFGDRFTPRTRGPPPTPKSPVKRFFEALSPKSKYNSNKEPREGSSASSFNPFKKKSVSDNRR